MYLVYKDIHVLSTRKVVLQPVLERLKRFDVDNS